MRDNAKVCAETMRFPLSGNTVTATEELVDYGQALPVRVEVTHFTCFVKLVSSFSTPLNLANIEH